MFLEVRGLGLSQEKMTLKELGCRPEVVSAPSLVSRRESAILQGDPHPAEWP